MSPRSNEALFESFRAGGDAGALGELFDRVAPALLRIALHLARDPAGAEDLVQATFLKAIEARAEWVDQRPVVPWLCGILQNRARSARRLEERRPDPTRLPSESPIDPVRVVEAAEFDEAVDAAIAVLPEPYQPVLRLHLAYGHAPAEIAHALSRPPGTVRSQLSRGLELLRKTLPASLTAAIALSISAGRGLAAVRECVLVQAAAVTPLVPVAGALAGGVLAMKTVITALGVLVVAGLAWLAWPRSEASIPHEVVQVGDSEPAAAMLEPEKHLAASVVEAPSERVALVIPPTVTTGTLNIACLWGDDGSRAPGVMLTVTPRSVSDGELLSRTIATGEDGQVVFSDLPAGVSHVTADRGGWMEVEIVAGVTVEAELTIPIGVNVRGRVVDEGGAPVPRARVWLSVGGLNFSDGRDVTVTGADGRFVLRSVEPERFVSAVTPGSRAAVPEPIRGESGSTVDVELVLRGRGASLLGRVSDSDGAPLRGARVVVGFRENRLGWSRGIYADYRPPPALETDERGEFRADGLEPGSKTELWVRAAGFCTWFAWVELGTDAIGTVAVRLQRGATVSGRVTDDEGKPVAGVGLLARSTAWFDRRSALDDLYAPDWVHAWALTDADGRYEIAALTPGTLLLRANTKEREARGEVQAADGERVTWDPVLADCTIHGRVVDARGMPLAGWEVSGQLPRDAGRPVRDTTDAEGKFRWKRCATAAYRLDARAADDALGARPFTLHGVRPGEGEVLVQIPDDAIASAAIEGTFLDADARAFEEAEVRCFGEGLYSWLSVKTDPSTGRFRIAPLPAGTYRLQGSTGKGAAARRTSWSEAITLEMRENRDFGLLQMPRPGAVLASVLDGEGEPLDGANVSVVESYGWGEIYWSAGDTVRGAVRIPYLAPGEYRIRIHGRNLPSVYQEVTVAAGEETMVEMTVPAGIPCRLLLSSATELLPLNVTFAWTRDGAPWEHYVNWWETGGEKTWPCQLLPGTYEVTITSESGKQEVNRFVVSPLDPVDREIPIQLP